MRLKIFCARKQSLYPQETNPIHGTRRKTPEKEEDEEAKDAKNEAHTRSERLTTRMRKK